MTSSKNLIQASAGNVAGGDFYPYTIDNSVRIQGTSSKYLSRSTALASSPTDAQKLSFSCWMKVNKIHQSGLGIFFNTMSSGYPTFAIYDYSGYSPHGEGSWEFQDYRPTPNPRYLMRADTISKQRDFSAWYHLYIVVDTTLSTGSDRYKLYLNGVPIPYTTTDQPAETPQNTDWHLFTTTNSAWGIYISPTLAINSTYGHDFYLAEAHAVDGTAYDISKFGEFKNGVWIPVEPSGISYGNGGFYLDFADSSDLGKDVSGNGNHYTSSGLTSSDQVTDTPTNNFATMNPLTKQSTISLSNGNLTVSGTSGNSAGSTFVYPTSGKWYCEVQINSTPENGTNELVGISNNIANPGAIYRAYASNGQYYNGSGWVAFGGAWSTNDIIGVAADIDNSQLSFYRNGTLQGTTQSFTFGQLDTVVVRTRATSSVFSFNFGQLGFTYTPPTDHLALCTANLPEPTIGPNSDTTSDENFNTVLWTGTSLARSITGVGFQPDFLWTKSRSTAESHRLHDAVRGGNGSVLYELNSNETSAEGTDTLVSSLDADGFSIAAGGNTPNVSGRTYVGWNWKANGSGVSNTDGDITSTVSANQDAGFSIITYTGNGTSGATIGHGLNAVPKTIWVKDRSDTNAFTNYFESLGTGSELYFGYNQYATSSNFWITSPTTSVFSASSSEYVNASAHTYVAYAFAEVEGFSSIGSYTGNGSADGPFIYTGFRPAFFLIKSTNLAGSWQLWDAARDSYNVMDNKLFPDISNAEQIDPAYYIDFVSNGIKLRSNASMSNQSGINFIYIAFAENPFKYANAR